MDWPVVLIKLRDYLFWFGPPYLVALLLGAATEVTVRKLLRLTVYRGKEAKKQRSDVAAKSGSTVPLAIALYRRLSSRSASPWQLPLEYYVWLSVLSQSLTWTALLVTGALSWPLTALRLPLSFFLASLLALLLRFALSKSESVAVPLQWASEEDEPGSVGLQQVLRDWWMGVRQRFDASSNSLVLTAGLGAIVVGLAPQYYSWLTGAAVAPLDTFMGAAAGVLLPFVPGTELPLLAALLVKGVHIDVVFALVLAASLSQPQIFGELRSKAGLRVGLLYMGAAWLLAFGVAWLLAPLLSALGLA